MVKLSDFEEIVLWDFEFNGKKGNRPTIDYWKGTYPVIFVGL